MAQVPFDGPRAEEQTGADLGVRKTIAGEVGDVALMSGEIVRVSEMCRWRFSPVAASSLVAR